MNRDEAKDVVGAVFGHAALAALRDGMPCSEETRGHVIAYAANAAGETIGKRDPGPWADVRMDGVWA